MDNRHQMLSESTRQKWAPLLNHASLPAIADQYKKTVTTILLENQERDLQENTVSGTGLGTVVGGLSTGTGIDSFDPILISLVRRAMPNLMAYDIAGVQPMNGPTGLVFAMKTKYTSRNGNEALYNEADTSFSGKNTITKNTSGTYPGSNAGAAGSNTGAPSSQNNGDHHDPFAPSDDTQDPFASNSSDADDLPF